MAFATEKRNVVVGVTGSIAAYKSAELVRLFMSRGYDVNVVMTESAQKFIGKATFEALSGNPVLTDFWTEDATVDIAHVQLAEWADAIVIAPASAETISKLASGSASNPLTATILASQAPLVIAPAMNVNMYAHPQTQANIAHLKEMGVNFIGPNDGSLACGTQGRGRMAEPWEIFYAVRRVLSPHDLEGQKIVVTAGLTRDSMDIMYGETQISSYKLGVEITREAYRRGAEVLLIHTGQRPKVPMSVQCVSVATNAELREAILKASAEKPAILVLSALSNQYRAIEGTGDFIAPVDVIDELTKQRGDGKMPVIMAFVAAVGELEDLFNKGRKIVHGTAIDLLVSKFAEGAAGLESNELWLMDNTGSEKQIATTYRSRAATQILDAAHHVL